MDEEIKVLPIENPSRSEIPVLIKRGKIRTELCVCYPCPGILPCRFLPSRFIQREQSETE